MEGSAESAGQVVEKASWGFVTAAAVATQQQDPVLVADWIVLLKSPQLMHPTRTPNYQSKSHLHLSLKVATDQPI